jgi:hypothetical protein
MSTKRSARSKLARLRRMSDRELYLQLSSCTGGAADSSRHYWLVRNVQTKRADTIVRHERERAAYMRVDAEMLETLGAALRGKPSVKLGKTVLQILWERVRERVCDEWDLCRKFKAGDAGFVLALWNVIRRGRPVTEWDLYLIIAVLAVRMGPEWMCKCSKN